MGIAVCGTLQRCNRCVIHLLHSLDRVTSKYGQKWLREIITREKKIVTAQNVFSTIETCWHWWTAVARISDKSDFKRNKIQINKQDDAVSDTFIQASVPVWNWFDGFISKTATSQFVIGASNGNFMCEERKWRPRIGYYTNRNEYATFEFIANVLGTCAALFSTRLDWYCYCYYPFIGVSAETRNRKWMLKLVVLLRAAVFNL